MEDYPVATQWRNLGAHECSRVTGWAVVGRRNSVPIEWCAVIGGIQLCVMDQVEIDVSVSPSAFCGRIKPLGHHAQTEVTVLCMRRERKIRGDEVKGGCMRAEMGESRSERVS